jgi:hypothetical protein
MRTRPDLRPHRARTGALVLFAVAGLLTACSGPGPGEKDVAYESLDALRESATAAGLTCLAFTPEEAGTPEVELGECDDTTLLAVFADDVDEDEFLALLPRQPAAEEEAALAGPNWVILSDTDQLVETQAGIGGEFLSDL